MYASRVGFEAARAWTGARGKRQRWPLALAGGTAEIIWDGGTPAPPTTDTPRESPQYGFDQHEFPRNDRAARAQVSEFLRPAGEVVDVCGGEPCKIDFTPEDGWTGGSNH